MIDYVFILAGGSGTRLWPASTSEKPKQFFSVRGDQSLLYLSLRRAEALEPTDGIVIITLNEQLKALEETLSSEGTPGCPLYVLPEPCARNTAPALGTAALWAAEGTGDRSPVILVMTADHLIEPIERFTEDVARAAELARAGNLVTFGIPPTRAETGYGYIEAGEVAGPGRKVTSFREKPDAETAEKFIAAGNFFWNSGMFCFTAEKYLAELAEHAPEVYNRLYTLSGTLPEEIKKRGYSLIMSGKSVENIYASLPSISIDYAVMEKSTRSAVVQASFSWNDVGSWDVVAELLEGEQPACPVFSSGASNNFVYADLPVALCGVDDLIVVVRNGVVLVCRKGESQQVKAVLEEVKKGGRSDLL